ncbi:putative Transcriptional regulator, MarR family [metagenome]|uniref:Putative Transcriptional regulator, MarR family n=1 Tax=metagenome TaxID=256318 RepID=A0A2P2CBI6_9ZZZZ
MSPAKAPGASSDEEPADGIALARLLAMGFRLAITGLHERLAERGWDDVRPPYGFVLLALRTGPLTVTDVAALMGMTKQAASQLVDAMAQSDYLVRSVDESDRRQRVLSLSTRGETLLGVVEEIYAEIEAEWADMASADDLRTTRDALTRIVLTANDGVLPAVRPTW